jgi:type II secretory pathway component PulF
MNPAETLTTFSYTAVDSAGAKSRGQVQAKSEQDAYRRLAATGLTPLKLLAQRHKGTRLKGRVRSKDVVQFTHQFAVLVEAGISIGEGLRSIADQEPNPRLRAVIIDVATRIEAGEQVAQALDVHRGVFGDVYVETIRAAEHSGNMTKSLEHLCDMLERSQDTKAQVRGALMYPACVISVLVLAVAFLITFVIPKFSRMFQERGVELPIFTKGMMMLGDAVQAYWWAILAAGVGGTFALVRMWRDPGGRALIDRGFHKIPFLNKILVGLAVARFARVLGLSLGSGLSLIECLALSARATGRPMLIGDAGRMADQVRAGRRLSQCLPECTYLTPFAKRMISAGEESAELTKMCNVIARHYDREATHLAKNIATIVEPLMVVGIAGIVLLVALSIFLPMWNMANLIK